MNSEELLPQTVLSKASIRGKEYAWQKDDVKGQSWQPGNKI